MKQNIRSLTRDTLERWLKDMGQPRFRADQILKWLYHHSVRSWDAMGNLPRSLRESLATSFDLDLPGFVEVRGAADSTRKFLWKLADGALIESVLIPANPAAHGGASARKTLCVSSQVGCAYGCRFCASGLEGWKRHLTPAEMVGQVLATEAWLDREATEASASDDPNSNRPRGRWIDNLVFMGMGEPLANYENLLKGLAVLNADWGMGIGARRITISTSGLAPQIQQLADEPPQFRLAISLHGPTDEVREKIMPINRRYPLDRLVEACDYYTRKRGKRVTLEYILIEGVNDEIHLTESLAALAQRLRAKVNLIPYNRVDGLSWHRPSETQQESFCRALKERGVNVTLRREKGHDIEAACGQLRLRAEREASGAVLAN